MPANEGQCICNVFESLLTTSVRSHVAIITFILQAVANVFSILSIFIVCKALITFWLSFMIFTNSSSLLSSSSHCPPIRLLVGSQFLLHDPPITLSYELALSPIATNDQSVFYRPRNNSFLITILPGCKIVSH